MTETFVEETLKSPQVLLGTAGGKGEFVSQRVSWRGRYGEEVASGVRDLLLRFLGPQ